jgi:hypothetical protein
MAKPIPYNPNLGKVTTPPQQPEQQAVRVVITPPASPAPVIPAQPNAARKGRSLLKKIGRPRKAAAKGANNR